MKTVFTTLYGSHLFGCPVPTSDEDYKSIHLETLHELLYEDTHALNDKDESGPFKVETETYSLRFFFEMLAKGRVIAMDMFFAPETFWRGSTDRAFWKQVQELRPYAVTRNIAPFAGYARQQAHKYGNKGMKILTVQKAIRLLKEKVSFQTMCDELKGMEGVRYTTEHAAGGDIRHIEICGKDWGETTSYDLWLPVLTELEGRYGERARLSTDGLDLKAQYQTIRIISEAIELLSTGFITFPRPEAATLLKIRQGVYGEAALRDLVDAKMDEMKAIKPLESLPEKPNWDVIKDFVHSTQRDFFKSVY